MADMSDDFTDYSRRLREEVRPVTVTAPRPQDAATSRPVLVSIQHNGSTTSVFELNLAEAATLRDALDAFIKEHPDA